MATMSFIKRKPRKPLVKKGKSARGRNRNKQRVRQFVDLVYEVNGGTVYHRINFRRERFKKNFLYALNKRKKEKTA